MKRIFQRALPALLLALFFFPDYALARNYSLWAGRATFPLPVGAAVKKESQKEFFVYPQGSNPQRTKAFAVVVRHRLSRAEQAAPLRELAEMRRRNFEDEGIKVTNFKVDTKRSKASMDLSGTITKSDAVPLAFKGKKTAVRGRFVGYRIGSEIVSAIALSERRTWNNKLTRAYRRVTDSLQVRRAK